MKKSEKSARIKVIKDGPYLVFGSLPLVTAKIMPDQNDYLLAWKKTKTFPAKETYSLCRCGESKNKPFCDGMHAKIEFKGTETADRKPFKTKAEKYTGQDLVLLDAVEYCASAHFCTRAGGTWDLVEQETGAEAKRIIKKEVADCPSGRLVLLDKKTKKEIEPKLKPGISAVFDTLTNTEGPLWVKGMIPIEGADGKAYELRNRVTLCRCGRSHNKPLCDGWHVSGAEG